MVEWLRVEHDGCGQCRHSHHSARAHPTHLTLPDPTTPHSITLQRGTYQLLLLDQVQVWGERRENMTLWSITSSPHQNLLPYHHLLPTPSVNHLLPTLLPPPHTTTSSPYHHLLPISITSSPYPSPPPHTITSSHTITSFPYHRLLPTPSPPPHTITSSPHHHLLLIPSPPPHTITSSHKPQRNNAG